MQELKLSFLKAKNIIADYGEDHIKKCAAQTDNLLLKSLTSEVLEVYKQGGGRNE